MKEPPSGMARRPRFRLLHSEPFPFLRGFFFPTDLGPPYSDSKRKSFPRQRFPLRYCVRVSSTSIPFFHTLQGILGSPSKSNHPLFVETSPRPIASSLRHEFQNLLFPTFLRGFFFPGKTEISPTCAAETFPIVKLSRPALSSLPPPDIFAFLRKEVLLPPRKIRDPQSLIQPLSSPTRSFSCSSLLVQLTRPFSKFSLLFCLYAPGETSLPWTFLTSEGTPFCFARRRECPRE